MEPKRRRSYVVNPQSSTARSKKRREQLNEIAAGLGYKTWNRLVTAILKGKAKVVLVQSDENSSNIVGET